MIERLDATGLKIMNEILLQLKGKKKRRFMEYFIVKIINNSENTTQSAFSINEIIRRYGNDEQLVLECLADLFEKENNERLDKLCSFYND